MEAAPDLLLRDLNNPQKLAVTHDSGPLLILAGAGSGKTRVLTYRIAHLVGARGVDPSHILAFTFTNKAAQEMRERIEGLLADLKGAWIGTFHGTCARILRREAAAIGFTSSFSIYDEQDQKDLIKDVLKGMNVSDREFRPASVMGKISACKNALVPPDEYRETALTRFDSTVADIYERYEGSLKARNAMDFDDLISRCLELFSTRPDVLEKYAGRFEHVLVDEYQDTNHAQFRLVEALGSKHGNLFVVGDDDQSIYGWRGADIGNILSFKGAFPNAEVVRLEQNYRSTGSILAAAGAVVGNNTARMEKTLWTEKAPGPVPELHIVADEQDEAERVAGTIVEIRRREGRGYSEFGVLYRTNAQSRALETSFQRAGVPYDLVGGTAFYQRKEIKDLLAYLRCVANPADDVSFKRIVDAPPRGAGVTSLERVAAFAATRGIGLQEAASLAADVEGVPPGAAKALSRLAGSFEEWRFKAASTPVGPLLEEIIEETGYARRLHKEEGGPGGPREENVLELVATCYHFVESREDPSLEAFVGEAALMSSVDRWDPSESAVTLMTAHNAKGLEFDVVFLVGLEEGLFPHASSLEDRDELEEERRLFYVAMTRARERVLCWAAERRRRGRQFVENGMSRFLGEIPPDLLQVHRGWSGAGAPSSPASAESVTSAAAAKKKARRKWPGVGDRVYHDSFGWGVVVVKETGGTPRCTVSFEHAGTKRIVTSFLKREEDWA
jgi:DNA helicase-2/ATP-dependent DNA helicase PcrA